MNVKISKKIKRTHDKQFSFVHLHSKSANDQSITEQGSKNRTKLRHLIIGKWKSADWVAAEYWQSIIYFIIANGFLFRAIHISVHPFISNTRIFPRCILKTGWFFENGNFSGVWVNLYSPDTSPSSVTHLFNIQFKQGRRTVICRAKNNKLSNLLLCNNTKRGGFQFLCGADACRLIFIGRKKKQKKKILKRKR